MPTLSRKIILLTGLCFLVYLFQACNKEEQTINQPAPDPLTAYLNIPTTPYNYSNPALPVHLQTPNLALQRNTPANNPVTDWGATLGRVLFYDKNLSINNSIACASCHKAENAFSDPATKSPGFNGGFTGR